MADNSAEERESGAWSSSGDGEEASPGEEEEEVEEDEEEVEEEDDEEGVEDDEEVEEVEDDEEVEEVEDNEEVEEVEDDEEVEEVEDDGEEVEESDEVEEVEGGEEEDEEEDEDGEEGESSDESSDGDLPPAQIVCLPSVDEEEPGGALGDALPKRQPAEAAGSREFRGVEGEGKDKKGSPIRDSFKPIPPSQPHAAPATGTSIREGVAGSSDTAVKGNSVHGGSFTERRNHQRSASSGSTSPARTSAGSLSLARAAVLQMAMRAAESPASAPRGFSALDMMPSLDSGESLEGGSSSDGGGGVVGDDD
ncbi:unnamed protein product, partial [Ascophyllum nodosum]